MNEKSEVPKSQQASAETKPTLKQQHAGKMLESGKLENFSNSRPLPDGVALQNDRTQKDTSTGTNSTGPKAQIVGTEKGKE